MIHHISNLSIGGVYLLQMRTANVQRRRNELLRKPASPELQSCHSIRHTAAQAVEATLLWSQHRDHADPGKVIETLIRGAGLVRMHIGNLSGATASLPP